MVLLCGGSKLKRLSSWSQRHSSRTVLDLKRSKYSPMAETMSSYFYHSSLYSFLILVMTGFSTPFTSLWLIKNPTLNWF